ncbi:hypothetical protein JCM1841_004261 [Sporobolomyces salmonicolor]
MSANPTLYASSFSGSRSPAATFHSTSLRLSLSRALTTDLASYFHERTLLEEQYIKSLHKLASRLHGQGKDAVFRELDQLPVDQRQGDKQLGAWADVRRTLENEVAQTANVHEQWRSKIADDVEAPLRNSVNKPDWARWGHAERDLANNVREYEGLIEKVQKAQAKGTKTSKFGGGSSSKLLTSQSALSSLGSSLTSSLPPFLSQTQALDLAHSAFLKECLVRCGTLTSDLGRERMEAGERLLVQVLAVDESAEAEEWALREGMAAGGGRANGAVGEFGETTRGSSTPREESIAEQRDEAGSIASGRTNAVSERQRANSRPIIAPPPVAPLPLPTSDDSRSLKERSNTFGGKLSSLMSGGGSSKSRDRSSSIPNSAKYANFNSPSAEPAPPVPPLERRGTGASANSDLLGGSASPAGLQPSLTPGKKRESLFPSGLGGGGNGGGGLFRRQSKMNALSDFDQSQGSPAMQQQQGGFTAEPAQMTSVDSEGFTVPPAGYDRAIGESVAGGGAAVGAGRSLMDDDEEDERPLGETSAIPKLSILPIPSSSLAPPSPSLPTESEADRLAALSSLKNSLGAPPSAAGAGLGRRATARGRRSEAGQPVRNTMYGAPVGAVAVGIERKDSADDETPLATIQQQQQPTTQRREAPPPPVSISPATSAFVPASVPAPSPAAPNRAMSILSSHSSIGGLSSHASHARPDPFASATSPGVRVSILETVNVLLKAGEVARVMVTGEVAISHRATDDKPLRIRINGFDQLEKAAPNPSFLTPTSSAGDGEYTISPALAAHGSTATVLKYQLRLSASAASSVPLAVRPTFRCEPNLARVIVVYSSNPSSLFASSASPFDEEDAEEQAQAPVQIEDLAIDLAFPAGQITSYQSKPATGSLLPSGGLSFALPAPTGPGEEKLLASIQTEGATAAPGPVSVRWTVKGRTVGAVSVEVLDGQDGEVAEVRRETVAGKYLAA